MARARTPPPQWSGVRRLPGLDGRLPTRRRAAVLLTTMGSLGDLYPVLSVARALGTAGIDARLALSPEDCDMARRWGLLATPVGPSQAEMCDRLGVTRDEIAAAVLHDPSPLLRDVLTPMLPALVEELAPLMSGVSCVAATAFALNAPLAAERADIPFVPLVLQPMLTFSALDPPAGRRFGPAIRNPRSAPARAWNRGFLGLARLVLSLRHRRDLDRVRAGLDLPPHSGTPLIDPGPADVPLRLGLWSADFAPRPADAPEELVLAGFPPAPEGTLPPEVQAWLDDGPPPLMVTLGSIAQSLGGTRFWDEAVALARGLGLRAVLLHGEAEVPDGPDILPLRYGAHAPLFPQAAAVIHHGGIGTTAEALRAGRPQLVVPVGGDQPDNAARVRDMGLGLVLPIERFRADRAQAMLGPFLDAFDYAQASATADAISAENGAGEAALHLASLALREAAR